MYEVKETYSYFKVIIFVSNCLCFCNSCPGPRDMYYRTISVQTLLIIIILYHELLKKSCIPSFHALVFVHSSEQVCPPPVAQPLPSPPNLYSKWACNGSLREDSQSEHLCILTFCANLTSHSAGAEGWGRWQLSIVSEAGRLNFTNTVLCCCYIESILCSPLFPFHRDRKRIKRECAGSVLSYLTAELRQLPLHSKTFPMTSLYLRKLPPKAFLLGFICSLILHEAT